MREFVQALRAIWTSWDTGDKLDFRGDFYQHTLMTPMFSHGPSPVGHPKVYVAAVGPAMTAVAGEVADGLCTHGFTTAEYVRQVTIPHLEEGLQRAGRARADVEVTIPVMTAIVEDERDSALDGLRSTIAFYGSTPAYRPVLDLHGWGALGDELHTLSVRGEWAAMAKLIPDELIHTMAVVGSAAEVGKEIRSRYAGAADRIQTGVLADESRMLELLDQLTGSD
jgi:probable F420-dependent oxidoreductase